MPSPGQLPTVLLVDDNPDDLFVMRQRLLRAGVQNPILSFEDGEEAMAHLKSVLEGKTARPCVLFLDLRMPRCGGFEVLKWVRAQPGLLEVQVVIVSTSALPEDATRAVQLGASQFVSKYPPPELLAEIVASATHGRPPANHR
jgi:CheY-like chemotaxis protein